MVTVESAFASPALAHGNVLKGPCSKVQALVAELFTGVKKGFKVWDTVDKPRPVERALIGSP